MRREEWTSSGWSRLTNSYPVVEEHVHAWVRRHAPGAAFLDYACGNGNLSRMAAENGAPAGVGIGISDVSVPNATERAAQAGFGPVTPFLQRDCEDSQLPAGRFDGCLCSGMLHDLDLTGQDVIDQVLSHLRGRNSRALSRDIWCG